MGFVSRGPEDLQAVAGLKYTCHPPSYQVKTLYGNYYQRACELNQISDCINLYNYNLI